MLFQIQIRQDSGGSGQIYNYITKPLAENIHVFVSFTYVIIALLGLFTAYRIYSSWQSGEEDNVIGSIAKWFLGMVLVIFLVTGLQMWLDSNPADDSGVEYNFNN